MPVTPETAVIDSAEGLSAERWRRAGAPRMLGEIALENEMLAWTLLQSAKKRKGYRLNGPYIVTETQGWEIINVKVRFESAAADQRLIGRLLGTIQSDIWVRRVTYTVRRPNFAPCSLWKGQSDYFNKLAPNMDLELIIESFCPYLISPEPTPLENIESVFECVCPAGLILRCSATLQMHVTNLRELCIGAATNEIPTEVILTFHGTRLPTGLYGSCDWSTLVEDLTAAGVLWEGGGCSPAGCP